MVKMSLKRTDGSCKDETWVCSIEDNQESSETSQTLQGANAPLPADGESLNDENKVQKEQSYLQTNHGNQPDSAASSFYNRWPVEYNSNTIQAMLESNENFKMDSLNNTSQSTATKRPNEKNFNTGGNNAPKSVNPRKRKKSQTSVNAQMQRNLPFPGFPFPIPSALPHNVNTIPNLATMGQVRPGIPMLSNANPNFMNTPFAPINMQGQLVQPQAIPYQYFYNFMYNQHLQAAMNQLPGVRKGANSSDASRVNPGAPQSGNPEQVSIHTGNSSAPVCVQNPNYRQPPVGHPGNRNETFLPPFYPPFQILSPFVPRYPVNKTFRNDPSSQIQAGHLNVARSFQNAGVILPVPEPSNPCEEYFRIYHCQTCLFSTDSLEDLERHVRADRTQTPYQVITTSGKELLCQLCEVMVGTTTKMQEHCRSMSHRHRVEYYNHVMEGGNRTKMMLKADTFYPVVLFCSVCEYSTESLVTLKVHCKEPNHMRNVSCSQYLATFSSVIEYCSCCLCYVQFLTKRELLVHMRSIEHRIKLSSKYKEGSIFDPKDVFSVKEQHSNRNQPQRIFLQQENILYNRRERSDSKKENEKQGSTEIPAPIDLSHLSSNTHTAPTVVSKYPNIIQPLNFSSGESYFQQPPIVQCKLCSGIFSETDAFVKHLQFHHGVSKKGLELIVPTTHAENPFQVRELPIERVENPYCIFPKQKSPSFDDKSPIRSPIESSTNQSSVVPERKAEMQPISHLDAVTRGENVASESYTCQGVAVSEQIKSSASPSGGRLITDPWLTQSERSPDKNQERGSADSSLRQQFCSSENALVAEDLSYSGLATRTFKNDSNTSGHTEIDNSLTTKSWTSRRDTPALQAAHASLGSIIPSSSEISIMHQHLATKVTPIGTETNIQPMSSQQYRPEDLTEVLPSSSEIFTMRQHLATKENLSTETTCQLMSSQQSWAEDLTETLQQENRPIPNAETENSSLSNYLNNTGKPILSTENLTNLNSDREGGIDPSLKTPIAGPNIEMDHSSSGTSEYSFDSAENGAEHILDDCIVEYYDTSNTNSPANVDRRIRNQPNTSVIDDIQISNVFSLQNHMYINDSVDQEANSDSDNGES